MKQSRAESILKDLAADFIERHSNRTSLVTVTSVDLSPDMKNAVIFLSVLPEEKGHQVVEFLERWRNDFREYTKKHARLRVIPHYEFRIDKGEMNRQRIEELIHQDKETSA